MNDNNQMILDDPKGRIKHFLAFVSGAIYSDAKQTRALIRALPFPPDLTHAYLHAYAQYAGRGCNRSQIYRGVSSRIRLSPRGL